LAEPGEHIVSITAYPDHQSLRERFCSGIVSRFRRLEPPEEEYGLIQRAFQHRSGRVISAGRLVLASVFLLAIWLDPSQPSRHANEAYSILGAYVAVAALYLVLTWNNWWLEYRLGIWAHGLDIALFAVMVFLTEGYTSPFFTFFVFIVLSATIRWGWKETALTSAVIIMLFFLSGWGALNWSAGDFEFRRFIIRGTYLIVLSLVLIWFGVNQYSMHLRKLGTFEAVAGDAAAKLPIQRALEYAAARTGATRVAFIWCDSGVRKECLLSTHRGHSALGSFGRETAIRAQPSRDYLRADERCNLADRAFV
jgi:hypothetical protein